MAEKTILVCDACGKPAVETVTIKAARGNSFRMTRISEPRRRGRPKTVAARPAASKPAAKKTAARKTTAPKRRGRPRKKPAA